MLELLKQLMGRQKKARRPTLDLAKLNAPVEAARAKLEAAQAEYTALLEKYRGHATAESVASAAFEAHGNDETANKVIDLSRDRAKRDLFKARSQRLVDRATAAHQEAEAKRDATVLETLDLIHGNAWPHIKAEWESNGKPALEAFAAFLRETDTILAEAETAMRESCRLRGDDTAWAKARGLEALNSVLTDVIAREVTIPVVQRIARVIR